ncbi:MAG: LPS export ABC transporter periplasmic protein LptC [Ferrovibrio sp.]
MMTADLTQQDTPKSRRNAEFAPRDGGRLLSALPRRRGFVRFMKFILPLIALGTVVTVIAWPQIAKRKMSIPLIFSDVETANAALVMNNPRYRGTDNSGQPYVVTADRAIQDPQDDKLVTLDRVQADVTMTSGEWWSLTADTGLYNGTAHLLDLYGNINVYGDRGNEMHGTTAEVNLQTKVISSDDKVWGHAAFGSIRANGLRVYDRGRVIVFINGVKTTVFPREKRG